MALESMFYGKDPADIIDALRKRKKPPVEVKECGGCRHRLMVFGEPACDMGHRNLEQCKHFDTRRSV